MAQTATYADTAKDKPHAVAGVGNFSAPRKMSLDLDTAALVLARLESPKDALSWWRARASCRLFRDATPAEALRRQRWRSQGFGGVCQNADVGGMLYYMENFGSRLVWTRQRARTAGSLADERLALAFAQCLKSIKRRDRHSNVRKAFVGSAIKASRHDAMRVICDFDASGNLCGAWLLQHGDLDHTVQLLRAESDSIERKQRGALKHGLTSATAHAMAQIDPARLARLVEAVANSADTAAKQCQTWFAKVTCGLVSARRPLEARAVAVRAAELYGSKQLLFAAAAGDAQLFDKYMPPEWRCAADGQVLAPAQSAARDALILAMRGAHLAIVERLVGVSVGRAAAHDIAACLRGQSDNAIIDNFSLNSSGCGSLLCAWQPQDFVRIASWLGLGPPSLLLAAYNLSTNKVIARVGNVDEADALLAWAFGPRHDAGHGVSVGGSEAQKARANSTNCRPGDAGAHALDGNNANTGHGNASGAKHNGGDREETVQRQRASYTDRPQHGWMHEDRTEFFARLVKLWGDRPALLAWLWGRYPHEVEWAASSCCINYSLITPHVACLEIACSAGGTSCGALGRLWMKYAGPTRHAVLERVMALHARTCPLQSNTGRSLARPFAHQHDDTGRSGQERPPQHQQCAHDDADADCVAQHWNVQHVEAASACASFCAVQGLLACMFADLTKSEPNRTVVGLWRRVLVARLGERKMQQAMESEFAASLNHNLFHCAGGLLGELTSRHYAPGTRAEFASALTEGLSQWVERRALEKASISGDHITPMRRLTRFALPLLPPGLRAELACQAAALCGCPILAGLAAERQLKAKARNKDAALWLRSHNNTQESAGASSHA